VSTLRPSVEGTSAHPLPSSAPAASSPTAGDRRGRRAAARRAGRLHGDEARDDNLVDAARSDRLTAPSIPKEVAMTSTLDRFSLEGRVAVVTGGTRGLGEGFARALGEAGAAVVIVGRDAAAAHEVLSDLARREVRAVFVEADITKRGDVERVLTSTIDQFGRVDVLVNNAGTCIHAPALEVTVEDWRHVMDVNLDALWTCSQVFGRTFVEQGSGTIINIGSMSGMIVNRPQWQPAYNASKAAVHHLTRSLAAEWGPYGVRVNALAPGYIKTGMSPVDDPQYRRNWIEDAPMQRYGSVEELAPAVVFLASDASSFITGSVLVADGGYTAF
jgi:NAD(P)-dependent dehydrogenase (short-subunit alcohol dehydrogenase family)